MERAEALIRVERGRPDAAELAAVVAVLLTRGAPGGAAREAPGPSPAAETRWRGERAGYAAPEGWR